VRLMRGLSKGQAAIALSLAIPALVAGVCLSADIWSVCQQRAELQETAYSAVLLGAAYLPADPATAESVASRYVTEHKDVGARTKVTYERVSRDRQTLTLIVERKAGYVFGGLLGTQRDAIVARARATIRPVRLVAPPVRVCPAKNELPSGSSWTTLSRSGLSVRNLLARVG
jgi:Flp pilus assembly protein TadG